MFPPFVAQNYAFWGVLPSVFSEFLHFALLLRPLSGILDAYRRSRSKDVGRWSGGLGEVGKRLAFPALFMLFLYRFLNCAFIRLLDFPYPALQRTGGAENRTQVGFLDSWKPDECAIFYQRPFSTAFTYLNQVFNGLRRGSKAITPCLVLKYCKFGEIGFLRHFWVGKPETSDFFNTKFRCFALKVRMFFSKKSDVSDINHGIFYFFLRAFFNFFRINWKNQQKSVPIDSWKLTTTDSKVWNNQLKIVLEWTLCDVKIFEGLQSRKQNF